MKKSNSLNSKLLALFEGDKERVGFVLDDGTIIECQNIAPEPEDSFDVSGEEILKYCDRAVATWHTHPGAKSNLSVGDADTFVLWPDLLHYIVGIDGVTAYAVVNNSVVRHEA